MPPDVPPLALVEKVAILVACRGRKSSEAAALLQMGVRTIYQKLRGYGIPPRTQNTPDEPERIAPDEADLRRVIAFLQADRPPLEPDEADEAEQIIHELQEQLQECRTACARQQKLIDSLQAQLNLPTRREITDRDGRYAETAYDRQLRTRDLFAEEGASHA